MLILTFLLSVESLHQIVNHSEELVSVDNIPMQNVENLYKYFKGKKCNFGKKNSIAYYMVGFMFIV